MTGQGGQSAASQAAAASNAYASGFNPQFFSEGKGIEPVYLVGGGVLLLAVGILIGKAL